ncbi:MAG: DUF4395 family protein [Gaiellaceae bacterium]
MRGHALFSFRSPPDERSARLVAAGAVTTAIEPLALAPPSSATGLADGFVARAAAGPALSQLGPATRVLPPPPGFRPCDASGSTKRFAQAIRAVVRDRSGACARPRPRRRRLVLIDVPGRLPMFGAALGLCVGCEVLALLMRTGIVLRSVRAECPNLRAP